MLAIGQIFLKLLTKLHIGNQEAMFTAEVMGNYLVLEWKEIKSFIWEKSDGKMATDFSYCVSFCL